MNEYLRDILSHTHALGFIDLVKLECDTNHTKVSSIDKDVNVAIIGHLKTPLVGVNGCFGLARLNILDKYLQFPAFAGTDSITVISDMDKSSGLQFSGDGHTSLYRFMGERAINENLNVPEILDLDEGLVISPSIKALNEFSYFCGAFEKAEQLFAVTTKNGDLIFELGSSAADKVSFAFHKDIGATVLKKWKYPIYSVMSVLRLIKSGDKCKMIFSKNTGAIKIVMESEHGVYSYVFAPR